MTFSVPGYRVDQLLGYGSQAEVWAGQVSPSGERVALKRIVTDSVAAARAGRAEAALLAALDHPNLIRLREFLALDSAMVLVLELAEAGSLADLLRRRGKLSPAEVVATVSPVAAALAHAHEQGVLHADVSAANILFTAAGQPKLADLGVARLFTTGADSLGTPAYLDPTVAAGGVPGAASDVFALGAVALHALTGTGPWRCPGTAEPTAEQVLAVAATGEIADLDVRLADFEPGLAAVISRVLDPEPHRRGTAAEFALDLRAALQPAPVVLAGGRILPKLGRHSVERAAARDGSPIGRPEFRPAATELAGGLPGDQVPADLTHVSRPQVRAVLAEVAADEPRRWSSSRWSKQILASKPAWRAMLTGAVVLVLLALWLLGGVPGRLGHRTASAVAPQPVSAAPRSAGSAPSTSIDPAVALEALDQIRAQAYAERRADLLAQVYDSSTLLAEDTAQLTRSVPVGCVLSGLRTSYADLQPTAVAGDRVQLRVNASLGAGSLVCAGTPRGKTAAAGPLRMAVTLTRVAGRVRISAEQLVSS
jgi:hypothetical protein